MWLEGCWLIRCCPWGQIWPILQPAITVSEISCALRQSLFTAVLRPNSLTSIFIIQLHPALQLHAHRATVGRPTTKSIYTHTLGLFSIVEQLFAQLLIFYYYFYYHLSASNLNWHSSFTWFECSSLKKNSYFWPLIYSRGVATAGRSTRLIRKKKFQNLR